MHKGKFKTFCNKGKFKQPPFFHSPPVWHSASKPSTRQFSPNFTLLFGRFQTQTNQRQSFALCKLCQAKVRVETVGRKAGEWQQAEGRGRKEKEESRQVAKKALPWTALRLNEHAKWESKRKRESDNNRSEIEWTTNGTKANRRMSKGLLTQIFRDSPQLTLPLTLSLSLDENKTKHNVNTWQNVFTDPFWLKESAAAFASAICKLVVQRETEREKGREWEERGRVLLGVPCLQFTW